MAINDKKRKAEMLLVDKLENSTQNRLNFVILQNLKDKNPFKSLKHCRMYLGLLAGSGSGSGSSVGKGQW
jgi:hypothetical protein